MCCHDVDIIFDAPFLASNIVTSYGPSFLLLFDGLASIFKTACRVLLMHRIIEEQIKLRRRLITTTDNAITEDL